MKYYKYFITGKDTYKVIRVDEKYPRGHKERYAEFRIDLRNGDMLCSCKGFYYTKRACKHAKGILEQLKAKGGILQWENEKSNYDLGLNND